MATALKPYRHISAYSTAFDKYLKTIPIEKLMIYLFDTVDASLLPFLLVQYNMGGFNGEILAETDNEKRELLKGAIKLHRIKGTPGGIREVIKRLGFTDIIIEEGWSNFTDGSPEPAANSWAYFRVIYVLPNNKAITSEITTNLIGLIESYKNARSVLANFSFSIPQNEVAILLETLTINIVNG